MSTRRKLRRKVVLALHVVRRGNGEKQLAHTLDITETSARLGGLNLPIEPGEIVEIRRGALKGRFEVVWVGAPGSTLDGQAGVYSLEVNKSIWGIELPEDERDVEINPGLLREPNPPVRRASATPGGRRTHERFPCNGSASIRAANSAYPLHGVVKDISEGGVYVELTAPMAVGTPVTIGLKIEGGWIEFAGTVKTSYPLVGMGVAFRNLTVSNRERITALLQKLQQQDAEEKSEFVVELGFHGQQHTPPKTPVSHTPANTYPLHVLSLACRTLADTIDSWRSRHSPAEIEELRKAVAALHEKITASSQAEVVNFFAEATPRGRG